MAEVGQLAKNLTYRFVRKIGEVEQRIVALRHQNEGGISLCSQLQKTAVRFGVNRVNLERGHLEWPLLSKT